MKTAKISSKGQITIPAKFRAKMNLRPSEDVVIEQLEDGTLVLRRRKTVADVAGKVSLKRPLASPEVERRAVGRLRAAHYASKLAGQAKRAKSAS